MHSRIGSRIDRRDSNVELYFFNYWWNYRSRARSARARDDCVTWRQSGVGDVRSSSFLGETQVVKVVAIQH